MSLFVFFISLLIVSQHVSGKHVPIIRSWRLRDVIALYWYVPWLHQLDVTFCILYFSSNSCSTCFGQPCAHHQELKLRDVIASCWYVPWLQGGCQVLLIGSASMHGRTTWQPDLTNSLQPRHIPTRGYKITQSSNPDDGHMVGRNMLSNY